jgi:hypothetical protein
LLENLYIGNYRNEDIPDILHLFALSFDKEMSTEWFFWKYQRSPWSSKGYVAVYRKKVVAFYGGLKLPFNFCGGKFWAYQFCDVMTHPEFRGRLFSKTPLVAMLGEMFYSENPMDFAFGFPSLKHARLQSLRLGGEGYRLVRLFKKEIIKKSIAPWRFKVKEEWDLFNSNREEKFLNYHNASLHIAKDQSYLRWRYRENPLKRYGFLVFEKLHVVKGFIIFSVEDCWLNIVEIIPKDTKTVRDILLSLENYISRNMSHIRGIKAWFHPREPLIRHLETLGYRDEESIPIAFRSVNEGCGVNSRTFYDSFYYRMGDYDAS